MVDSFQFDVFLSHSSKDKDIVRAIGERLRADGLHVWFDEWVIKAGDSILAKIEDGLESSRVLVLFMTGNAFGSDWTQLEAGTFRFRDPQNKARRFIPLRLDDAPLRGSLGQFLYIDWRVEDKDQAYVQLLEACKASASPLHQLTDRVSNAVDLNQSTPTHDLRIRIDPAWKAHRQLAQVRLLNAGVRPILVDSWFVSWKDNSGFGSINCERGTLPIRLLDHERTDLLVDIGDKPIEQLKSFGVIDAEQRFWPVAEAELVRFMHQAQLDAPLRPKPVTKEPEQPSDVSITVELAERKGTSPRLEVRFKNLGPNVLELRSASVDWEYEEPRWMPKVPAQPHVGESGREVSMQLEGHNRNLSPGSEAIYFLALQDPFAQGIIDLLKPDVPDHNIRVRIVASRWKWTAADDEVPGAVRAFAELVLSNQDRDHRPN